MNLRKMMRGLIFSFTQAPPLIGIVLAQNTFHEPNCLDDPNNPTMCLDNGCIAQDGQCYPAPGVGPDGQLTQGCVCVPNHPTPQPRACVRVIDQFSGQLVCMDLNCPPTHDRYDCDPVTCRCPAIRVFGDPSARCVPSTADPTSCQDFGCAAAGGICRPLEAQGTNGQELGGCECIFPASPADICNTFRNQVGVLGCYDVACGSGIDYECAPAGCGCTCTGIIPTSSLTLVWTNKAEMIWSGLGTRCALVYNLYRIVAARLTDVDRNGVADYYGSCFRNGLVAPTATDATVPAPGLTAYYLVTAENLPPVPGASGEGTMGTASNGLTRPNLTPCPNPPPPFP